MFFVCLTLIDENLVVLDVSCTLLWNNPTLARLCQAPSIHVCIRFFLVISVFRQRRASLFNEQQQQ
jgi:hypothetical protein